MSQESKPIEEGSEGSSPEQYIKSLEETLSKKLGEQDKKLGNFYESQKQLIEAINSMSSAKSEPPKTDSYEISDLLIRDPDKAVSIIEERVEKKVKQKLEAQVRQQNEENQVFNNLISDFPELNYKNHELTQAAVEIYSSMSERDKASPIAFEAAVTKAALKVGLPPKSKRRQSDDGEFSLSTKTSPKQSSAKISPKTLFWAEKMGLDTSDKKMLERLSKNAQKDYSKYGG